MTAAAGVGLTHPLIRYSILLGHHLNKTECCSSEMALMIVLLLMPFSAAEEAEKDVKAAAEAMNKQLPKEAQAGSMMPLTEETKSKEKEEGGEASEEKKQQQQDQVLDTFDVEIEALDTVRQKKIGGTCKSDAE